MIKGLQKKVVVAALLLLALVAAACGDDAGSDGDSGGKGDITVGVSGAFAENQIVAEMYAQVLEDAGYNVERQMDIGTREVSQAALDKGEIDVVPEYLTSLQLFLDKDAEAGSDVDATAGNIRALVKDRGLVLLNPSGANDTNAIVVAEKTAADRNLEKVSDLGPIAGELIFGGPPECPERPLCAIGLKDKYGIEFKEFKPLDSGGALTVAALEGGEIDVALLFSTSSVIKAKNFVVLEDDKQLQAADNITPLARDEILTDEVEELLNAVSEKLTTENITELNAKVELDKQEPEDVAREFLEDEGLL